MNKERVANAPLSVQLLLTRACNLSCYYCSATQFSHKDRQPELSTAEWIKLIKRLKEIQVFKLDFSGGEIFSRRDIFEILGTAAQCKFPRMTINTNGTMFTPEVTRKLQEYNFKSIAVSLDGTEQTHNRIRGKDAFARTIEGITNLLEAGINPSILFTPIKENFRQVPQLVDILYTLGIRNLNFNNLHATGSSSKIYNQIHLDCFDDELEFRDILDRVREKYRDFHMDNPETQYKSFPLRHQLHNQSSAARQPQQLKSCSAGTSSCVVTAGGWVAPCSELFDFNGGNIREQDILEIWRHSEKLRAFREISKKTTGDIAFCSDCDYNVFCSSGCRADAYGAYRDILAPDPFCPYWQKNGPMRQPEADVK